MGKTFVVSAVIAAGLNAALVVLAAVGGGLGTVVLPGLLLGTLAFTYAALHGGRREGDAFLGSTQGGPAALIAAVAGWLVNLAMAAYIAILGSGYIVWMFLTITAPIYLVDTLVVVAGVLARRRGATA